MAIVACVEGLGSARRTAPGSDRASIFWGALSEGDIRANRRTPRHRQEPHRERLQEAARGAYARGYSAGGHQMKCAQIHVNLAAHLLGGLEPKEVAEIRGHLASCPGCQNELLELQRVNR